MKKLLSLFTALPLVAILMFSTFVFAGTGDIVIEGKYVEVPSNGMFYSASYFPDYNEADQGVTGNGKSAKAYIDAVSTDSATLVFRHNSDSATTTYTFSTSETISSNIRIIIEKGAILSIAVAQTLTINGPFDAGPYQVFSGAGDVNFRGISSAYVNWWVTSGTGLLTDKWIVDLQKAVDSITNSYQTKEVIFSSGYYEVDSETELSNATSAVRLVIKAEVPRATYIYLADASNCSILAASGTTAQHPVIIDGLVLRGNHANQTVAHPLIEIKNVFDLHLRYLEASNSKGEGIKIDGSTDSRAFLRLDNVLTTGNQSFGVYLLGSLSGINIQNCRMESNADYGIKIEDCYNVVVRECYFEPNNGGILADNSQKVFIENNYIYESHSFAYAINFINGSHSGYVGPQDVLHRGGGIGSDSFWLRFDNTTYDNVYLNHGAIYSTGEGKVTKLKIYDAGNNTCLMPDVNVIRPAMNPVYEDNYYPQLTGYLKEIGGAAGNLTTNYILYSEMLTNAAWDDATATAINYESYTLPHGASAQFYQRVAFTDGPSAGNTSFIDQDVTIAVKTGDVLTFSIWVKSIGLGSTTVVPMLYLGDSGANFSVERAFDVKSIAVVGTTVGWKRLSVTVVATADAATMVCKLMNARNAATNINFWGAQLNKGKLAPYIKTEAATVSLYPGFRTSHIYAHHGATLGFFDLGSVSGAVDVYAYKGKYHKMTLSDNITDLNLHHANEAGAEIVLEIVQTAAGNKTVTFDGLVDIEGGAYTLTVAANAVDILTFFWDGSRYRETSRAQDVK